MHTAGLKRMKRRIEQKGFSLTEVLVSILVLAIGIIGAAGMQLRALRTSQQSAFQAAALELAVEMADRMRMNDRAMHSAEEGDPFLGLDYSTRTEPVAPTTLCYGRNASCDAAQMARFDIYEWERRLKTALPLARAVICRDASPWDSAVGGYTWKCDTPSSNSGDAPLIVKIGWQGKNPDGSPIQDDSKQFPPVIVLVVEPVVS
jgi:type IV pilus assembly protein PilV